MRIIDILQNKQVSVSFEFFPPKNPDLEQVLFDTMESLKDEKADFASVTFGAGGSSSEKTLEWTKRIGNSCNLATMMHLTCVGFKKEQVDDIFGKLHKAGIENILALRGDMPKDGSLNPDSMEFPHASDLIQYIKGAKHDFCIGVAGYPECHPESVSADTDIDMLKRKIDAGADFIITQLFFDNDVFFNFRDRLAAAKINIPVIAGIMPIVNAGQVVNFTKMCKATLPDKLLSDISNCPENEVINIGVDFAVRQCKELIKNGIDGLHFYTLNRSTATKSVLDKLSKVSFI